MSYEVKQDAYEGPIGVLLSLIQAQNVDVYQISITQLVQDYLGQIENRRALDLEVATEFLLVAATLLEIKCRRLFPNDTLLDEEDDVAFFEERDLLLARLLECKTYRDVSVVLSEMLAIGSKRHPRTAGFGDELKHLLYDPLTKIVPQDLYNAYIRVFERAPKALSMPDVHVTPLPKMSVAQARDRIIVLLGGNRAGTFDEICKESRLRIDVVVYFLGLLELIHMGKVSVRQEASNAPIHIALV